MKEAEIRPEALVAENLRLYKEDVESMMKEREGFVEVPCPACGSGAWSLAFTKEGFRHLKCSVCETLYISSRPTFDMLMDYYRNALSIKHWNDVLFPATEEARRKKIFNHRVKNVLGACREHDANYDCIVDVGAGFGTFCEIMMGTGQFRRVIAVEPCQELAESCRSHGVETLAGAIEEIDLEDFSVITAFELIEHLFCPRKFIEDCHRALTEGGLLILTTPNIKGFDLAMLGELSQNIGGPNHLQLFHPESLKLLLENCGFEVLEWSTPGKLDAEIVRRKINDGEFDGFPFLTFLLTDDFQRFLVEKRLSSHMMMVARKG